MSLAAHTSEGPLPVLRWSPTRRRRMERVRDRILFGLGADAPLFEEVLPDDLALARFGHLPISVSWRRPLSLLEVNQMAPTAEVRQRRGRA